jgi:peroxiredoxin
MDQTVRKVIAAVYFISFAVFPWLVLSPDISFTKIIPWRLEAFCALAIGGAILFRLAWPKQGWGIALVITSLGYGTAYKLASFIPDVSPYPFSLSWSEASRYYYASLWLSKNIYGFSIPPSVLHPSRYLLQAVPFLLPNSSLWFSRFWQVVLWVITAGATSWLLVVRLHLSGRKQPAVISLGLLLWGFLFLFQGPVYYQLLFMVILVLWGYHKDHFWRTLTVVLIASLWAGISRINWLPVPGMLAATLYLLETHLKDKSSWRYLSAPATWVVFGTIFGYISQWAYQYWSGNPLAWFGSSFTSDLLWYRLLPNMTYPLGILPSAILVSLPLAGLIILRVVKHWKEFHPIRLLGLAAILGVLFVGGIIVSVKIGGGSNLHNLDAYLTLLLVIGSAVFFDRFEPDQSTPSWSVLDITTHKYSDWRNTVENILIVGALVIPLYFILSNGGKIPQRDYSAADAAIQTINQATRQATEQGGEVLFISQRQLLTFNYVHDVTLVPDDELVFLMEMAMAGNAAYMDTFQVAIRQQRFSMIVSEPLVIQWQGRNHSFGEENDAWVRGVSEPVLCYYEPSIQLDSVGLMLYTPRTSPCN